MRATLPRVTAIAVVLIVTIAWAQAVAEEGATYAALQLAYGREMNARQHYLAYAAGAEREGHEATACLFRAVARAESLHANAFRVNIEQLGGEAKFEAASGAVRETPENLRESIRIEQAEFAGLYPRFANLAREEFLYEPLAWFNYARGAESTHALRFRDALARLEDTPPARPVQVLVMTSLSPAGAPPAGAECFVCPGDGSVFASRMKRCPNCGTRGERFVAFACPGPP